MAADWKILFIALLQFRLVRSATKPNVILLLTDDQDINLGGQTPMKFTLNFFRKYGTFLDHFYVNTPICCPSRATLISGRYPHNFVNTTGRGCMHMNVNDRGFSNTSIGVYMKALGYKTGHFGKYFNPGEDGMGPFCAGEALPGFDEWFSMCDDNHYFQNDFVVNGKQWRSGIDPKDYMTSLIGNASLSFITSALEKEESFFTYIAPHAPHVPATPAPWYQDYFLDLKAPRTPNYNYTGKDHHYVIRQQSHLTELVAGMSDELFRNRWRTLLSVDDIMKEVVSVLEKNGQLSNTYFIWTSDHGFQLGQFNLPSCKIQPYEHDIRVPLHLAGPGVPAGKVLADVASTVDLAPTMIEFGGGVPPKSMDGSSLKELFGKSPASHDKSMLEYWNEGEVIRYEHLIDGPNNTYLGVRLCNETHNFLYVEYYQNTLPKTFLEHPPVEFELFDMSIDYYQLKNVYNESTYKDLIAELHKFIHAKALCSGEDCRKLN